MAADPLPLPRMLAEGDRDSDIPDECQVYLRPRATLLRMHETVWRPPTDVFETHEAYVIRIELAGMKKEEIHVNLDRGILTVSGDRRDPSTEKKIRYRQVEIKYGTYFVRFRLPRDVKTSEIDASYDNGFLEIVLPKITEEKSRSAAIDVPVD